MMGNEAAALVSAALAARKNAYVPYSGYPVGAAVLGEDGNIFTGCNVENVSYPAGMCAERNAIGSAVTAGYTSFQGIAVAGSDKGFTMPCGICRQVIAEFQSPWSLWQKIKTTIKFLMEANCFPMLLKKAV